MRVEIVAAISAIYISLMSLCAHGEDAPRSAVPEAAAREAAQKAIQSAYAAKLNDPTAAGKVDLAHKLLELAKSKQDDAATRYVELSDARDLSAAAGDMAVSFAAVDEMASQFVVDPLEMKFDLLKRPIPNARALVLSSIEVSHDALQAEKLDLAAKSAAIGLAGAQHSRDASLRSQAQTQVQEVQKQQRDARQADAARKRLADHPTDPEANLTLGRYLCGDLGRWGDGLPHLARCSDAALKQLAKRDLAAPSQAADQLALADAWWDLPQSTRALPAADARRRAAYWYEKALPDLTGLAKVRAQERAAQASGQAADLPPIDASQWIALAQNGRRWDKQPVEGLGLQQTPGGVVVRNTSRSRVNFVFPQLLGGDFDITFSAAGGQLLVICAGDGADRAIYLNLPADSEVHTTRFHRSGGQVAAEIDGKPTNVREFAAPPNLAGYFGIQLNPGQQATLRGMSIR